MLKEELEKGVVAIIGPKDDRDDPKKVNKILIIYKYYNLYF